MTGMLQAIIQLYADQLYSMYRSGMITGEQALIILADYIGGFER